MKKFAILVAVVALVGCSQNDEGLDNITSTPEKSQTEFYASMPECDTRTYVEDNKYLRWNAGDEITIFAGNSYNGHWQFAGEDGANSGKFNEIEESGFVTGTPLDLTANYAIYPYDENITITEAGVVSLTLPAVQEYNHTYANSFGEGANTMMAVTENTSDNFLAFKNLCGYLKLKFYGEDVTVKSITVKGNNGEKIAGKATVSMAYGGEPTITMGDDATDTITIDCGEGVALSNDAANPTIFWVVIPETTFEGGITIEVTDLNDQTFSKTTTNAVPIENNLIQPMAALGVEVAPAGPANNEIWYTNGSTTEPTEPYDKTVFGATYLSNSYDAEKECWVIKFDGEVTSIGEDAFWSCELISITIPDSVTSIGEDAFSCCESLTSVHITDIAAWCNIDFANYYANPLLYAKNLYLKGELVTNLIIPNGVTTIRDFAFAHCASLTSVAIPDGVTEIGLRAFYCCNSLTSTTIPKSVTSFGRGAFGGCAGTLTIYCDIPSVSSNMDAIFAGSFTKIIIGDSVNSIGDYAFYGCDSCESITIGRGVTTIGSAFQYFTEQSNLKRVDINDLSAWCKIDFTNYASNPLSTCNADLYLCGIKLRYIVIPNDITVVKSHTFRDWDNIESVTIPNNVTVIEEGAFMYCKGLTDVVIENGITVINKDTFRGCSKLANVSIPNSVVSIGYDAFSSTGLKEVTIPDSVTRIDTYAFLDCTNLETITIGSGVTSIGSQAFYFCKSLKAIYCKPTIPPTISGDTLAFTYYPVLYVPVSDDDSIINAYKNTSNWSNRVSQIKPYDFD